jgi:hypothetical protein
MNINIAQAAAIWDALPREVRGAWYALSGLEMPALIESVEALVSSPWDQFDDSDALVLALALDAASKFAVALYSCGVLRVQSEARDPAALDVPPTNKQQGTNDETLEIPSFLRRNRVQ